MSPILTEKKDLAEILQDVSDIYKRLSEAGCGDKEKAIAPYTARRGEGSGNYDRSSWQLGLAPCLAAFDDLKGAS